MPHHMTMSPNETRVLHAIAGVLVILIAVSVLSALKGGRRKARPLRPQYASQQKRRKPALARRVSRTIGRSSRGVVGVLFWSIVYPLLYPLALFVGSRRGALIEASLDDLQQVLRAHNHRCGHPVCVPFLFWPQWFARCRACKKWIQLQEIPSIDGGRIELMIVRGSLESDPCSRRYIPSRSAAAPSVQPVPAAIPAAPSTSQNQASQGTAKTA